MLEAAEDGAEDDEPFAILEENAEAVALFLRVCTAWRVGPLGGVLGLDWQFVDMDARYGGRAPSREAWEGLKVMESAARAEMNRKRDR